MCLICEELGRGVCLLVGLDNGLLFSPEVFAVGALICMQWEWQRS